MKEQKLPIFLLIILDLILVSGIFLISFKDKKQTGEEDIHQEVLSEQTYEEEPVIEKKKFSDIDICCEERCYNLDATDIEEFFDDEQLNEKRLMSYVLEDIFPFFEKNFGGTTIVKNGKGSFVTWVADKRPELSGLYKDLQNVLKRDVYPDEILIYKKELPGTDGSYAQRYIEIDNSRQKLYYWYKGKVEKIIRLSGPKYGFQVYGVFPIIDKGIAPIAPSGNYMPYWMAFYYSPRQDSWYGLHALIWHYNDDGKRVYESLDNIGKRKSAGCIRMLVEDAKYLYERMEKGERILIHE